MSDTVSVTEYEKVRVQLTAADLAYLRQELPNQVGVIPTGEYGWYQIEAKSYVGFVVLPSGLTLRIVPKVEIPTLFALIAKVYDPDTEFLREESQSYTTVEELFEFVVQFFVVHVEDLITRGILRGYRSVKEDLVAIRGRLLIAETMTKRPAIRDRHWCRHSEFTPDVPENRILKWTAYTLKAYHYRESGLYARLRRIQRALANVELDPQAVDLFSRLSYHRMNELYRPALRLARLLLNHLTVSGTAGREPFVAFLIDMNSLFERYLTVVIQEHLGKDSLRVEGQDRLPLDASSQVMMRPDIVIYRDDTPLLVLDAKYKLEEGQGDLYQMIAYCHTTDLPRGVLVHPAWEEAPSGSVRVRGSRGIEISYYALDLSGTPRELEVAARSLVESLRSLLLLSRQEVAI